MHTMSSDGARTPAEAMRIYKDKGYDFIALTDHWHVNEPDEYEGMLVLSGVEYDLTRDECYHIVGYGLREDPRLERGAGPQKMIDAIKNAGGVATLAHPAWSLQRPDKMVQLKGVDCTEIYNSVSGYPFSALPYSGTLIDVATTMGFRAVLTSTDDTHYYGEDAGRGIVYVKATELSRDAIISGILKGDVVPTNGPFIEWELRGSRFAVTVPDGCRYVQFFTNKYYSPQTTATGGTVREAYFDVDPKVTFIRAEAVGFDGLTAYTQYIYF